MKTNGGIKKLWLELTADMICIEMTHPTVRGSVSLQSTLKLHKLDNFWLALGNWGGV
jgi:hypothetical protein